MRVLTHADVGWSRGILVDILGIPEEKLLFDDGCSVYQAQVVYQLRIIWSRLQRTIDQLPHSLFKFQ